jgi:YHS domain-containing protein
MEGLLSFLIFAVFFFLMMRYGCGAHMMHGHGGSHEHGKHNSNQQKHIDPVCGMQVDVDQGYGKMHEGMLYRFCSRGCLDKFESDPEKYVKNQQAHDEHHHEGGE